MTRPFNASSYATLMVLVSACSASEDHAPFCYEARCTPSGAVKVKTAAQAGSGGLGTGVVERTVTIKGEAVEVIGFDHWIEASGTFSVSAPTLDGGLVKQSVAPTFSLDDVLASKEAWMTATSTNVPDYMPGVVPFDATSAGSTTILIPILRRSELEDVARSLTTLPTLDATKAQLVVRFVNASLEPVPKVSVQIPGGAAATRAYDLRSSFTDDATATGTRGLAVFINVNASATPASLTLTTSGAVNREFDVKVVAGAATLVQVVI